MVSYSGSRPDVFSNIAALKRISRKTYAVELFFSKIIGCQPVTLQIQSSTPDISIEFFIFILFGAAFS